jgi:CubicO group peptidase (beta-lactamase class C family)
MTAPPFDQLDARITQAMKDYAIPGVAVGVWADNQEHLKGFGVTNVDQPLPVDGDTVFRIGSTTKTFTGTVMMRLVETGHIDLEQPVRRYLPDFAVADESASAAVTVRQLLNHTSGWNGDDIQDFGRGDDAITHYVSSMTKFPQLTPPGKVFAYNNAGLVVAGRIIETITAGTYESAVRDLVLEPLQLNHTHYFTDEIIGPNIAASHDVVDGKPVVDVDFWAFPRSCHPTGGLMSTARDQLRYARSHLGEPTVPPILSPQSVAAMRSNPGPGGTLQVELTGMGVTWMLRPSAQQLTIVQHGGTWAGQHSGFFMVPDRNFAMTVLTNSQGGTQLLDDLFASDWALNAFAGVTNLPVEWKYPDLTPYVGQYIGHEIHQSGNLVQVVVDWQAGEKQLVGTLVSDNPDDPINEKIGLAFYESDFGPDYGVDLDDAHVATGSRSDFVRGPDGNIAWFRSHGRLYRRQ